jgi:hypothetical protein
LSDRNLQFQSLDLGRQDLQGDAQNLTTLTGLSLQLRLALQFEFYAGIDAFACEKKRAIYDCRFRWLIFCTNNRFSPLENGRGGRQQNMKL